MMHDFVCCEDVPSHLLLSSDVIPCRGEARLNAVLASTSPGDVVPGAVQLACKAAPTLLDLYTGHGAAVATSSMGRRPSLATGTGTPARVVNIDTCLVR